MDMSENEAKSENLGDFNNKTTIKFDDYQLMKNVANET